MNDRFEAERLLVRQRFEVNMVKDVLHELLVLSYGERLFGLLEEVVEIGAVHIEDGPMLALLEKLQQLNVQLLLELSVELVGLVDRRSE